MRLVIDLQGAQGANHRRGIGRYSRELALAMVRRPRGHEVVVALNGAMTDTAEQLAGSLPRDRVAVWFPPEPATPGRFAREAAEIVRAQFLASLRPDLVHVSSVFEGLGDRTVTRSPPSLERLKLVGTCYDLIPLIRHADYLGRGGVLERHAPWYYACLHEMACMEGLLAISGSSRQEALDHLALDPASVFDIGTGVDPEFRPGPCDAAERAALHRRYGLADPFILFVGAGDVRKNEAALVQAYARLPEALRARHQLLLVGDVAEAALHRTLERAGVPPGRLVVVPFVARATCRVSTGHANCSSSRPCTRGSACPPPRPWRAARPCWPATPAACQRWWACPMRCSTRRGRRTSPTGWPVC